MLLVPKQKERYLQAFFLAMAVSAAFFVYFMAKDQGYFLYYGDFNVQQVTFYKQAHQAVRSGNIFWNWNTDLGANFIGSYSFYLLGSPFFWLTIPFPNDFVPHLMGPLLILKFSCASLTAYCYLRRFTRYTHTALIGGLLYAFSGFSVYNVFFNHFHEAIVYFPLLLLALELFMAENRRGLVAVMIFLTAFSNYFFFYGMVVFCVIYWFIRIFSGCWKFKVKNFLWLIFEIILGVAASAVILLPAAITAASNSRVDSIITGWGALVYTKPQVILYIIQSFFFPPDNPARPVFFPDANEKWSSIAGWLPLFGMTGVIAWLQNKKGSWQKRLITTMIIMALVPVLNCSFYMFNSSYYARWYYMPILIMSLVTALALEDPDINWSSAFRWSLGITLAYTVGVGLFPSGYDKGKFTGYGNYTEAGVKGSFYHGRFWTTCAFAIGSLLIAMICTYLHGNLRKLGDGTSRGQYLHNMRSKMPAFWRVSLCCVCVISIAYSAVHIGWGKSHSYETNNYIIPDLLEGKVVLDIEDGERIDVYDGMDNTGMFLNYPCIQCFHSVVPKSIMQYYPYVGVTRDVASRPDVSVYEIRYLLNVRYMLDYTEDENSFADASGTLIAGFEYVDTQDEYDIYENQYHIPYGFTYEYSVSETEVDNSFSNSHAGIMLKAMILSDEDAEKYSDILPAIENVDYTTFNEEGYLSDCEKLRATSLENTFSIDNRGFTSTVDLERENLVFYAVPFEDGWTAYVDGKKADIVKANIGFMAVRCGEGKHTVRFSYMTPGLIPGLIITAGAVCAFIIYIALWFVFKKKHPEKVEISYPEGEKKLEQWAEHDRLCLDYEAVMGDELKDDELIMNENEDFLMRPVGFNVPHDAQDDFRFFDDGGDFNFDETADQNNADKDDLSE